MYDYIPSPHPFDNLGITQVKDPSQLKPGEYSQLLNMYSEQEGALAVRTGHKNLNPALGLTGTIYSLSKLNIDDAVDANNPRYLGNGGNIYRTNPAFVPTNITNGLGLSAARWTATAIQCWNIRNAGALLRDRRSRDEG